MTPEANDLPEDLEQLRQQLTEFRSTHRLRSRLPESCWAAAAEVAIHHGVHRTARVLHLDYVGLKKRVESRKRPKVKRKPASPTFLELVGPTASASPCRLEVEAASGKFRLELPAVAAADLAPLLRAFLGQ